MIAMPVFSPGGELEWTEPPDVLAGIHTFRESRFQMQKTVDQGLHVKAIHKTDRADPKKACPAEKDIAQQD